MKRLLIFLAFVWFGLSLSLKAEEAVIDSLYWSEASREVEERNYEEAARTYVKLIEKGDSLFRVYAIDRVEDMREKYSIDELELQSFMEAYFYYYPVSCYSDFGWFPLFRKREAKAYSV